MDTTHQALEAAYQPTNVASIGKGAAPHMFKNDWSGYLDRCQSDQVAFPMDAPMENCFSAVFAWWRVNSRRFPTLYRMYLDFANYPGTTVEF